MNNNVRFLVEVLRHAEWRNGFIRIVDISTQRQSICWHRLAIDCAEMFNSTLILTNVVTPEMLANQLTWKMKDHLLILGASEDDDGRRLYEEICDAVFEEVARWELTDE